MKSIIFALALLTCSVAALAQPAPGDRPPPPPDGGGDQVGAPPGGPGRGEGPGRRFDGAGGPGRPDGPGMGRGPGGGGAGGGPGGGGPGMPPQMMAMQRYLDLVNQYSKMASDPQTAGVAAVVAASDILKPRGTDTAIQWFNKILPDAKNPAVRRAIHGQLADLYKSSGQQDKALEELHTLITEAGAESSPAGR